VLRPSDAFLVGEGRLVSSSLCRSCVLSHSLWLLWLLLVLSTVRFAIQAPAVFLVVAFLVVVVALDIPSISLLSTCPIALLLSTTVVAVSYSPSQVDFFLWYLIQANLCLLEALYYIIETDLRYAGCFQRKNCRLVLQR
jgi:hypothetical protein